ncbi:glycosyltransferase family 2 protein [Flavihumibacter petaseus]|uniref:Putative glycosyltransferase n=1 Tax=Flavihumibacter petaseus NBRC 106054 TaxID=1220578 RepID=A0A0E9N225_9BACT|nr:glycosyltransferase family 2 protein [Flavihumibacter petaseus]GAO43711.1 putative glycosyltransferase [Flavihumibacter petaseus NBRC 106054]
MNLSIIIVNYRSEQLIKDALQSFMPVSDIGLEIIIADNGSDPGELAELSTSFPEVRVVSMGYNAGFARANNEGIRAARGEVILLLNPDILDPWHSIASCYHRFKADTVIAAGVQLLNADQSPQISGNYFMTGGLNHLLPLPVIGSLVKAAGSLAGVKKTNLPDSAGKEMVDWINGAFIMVRKNDLETTGLLDEDFFLYAEEIEWCSRLRKAGKLCIYGDLKLIHLQGATANEVFGSSGKGYYNLYDRKGLQLLVSNFLRIRKQFGNGWFLVHLAFYLLEIPLLWLKWLIGQLPGINGIPFRMPKGYTANMMRLLQLTPRIMRNAPYFYKLL